MSLLKALSATLALCATTAFAFEGRITVAISSGGETQTLLYTVGTNNMRIECVDTNLPHARNIVGLDSGAVTILFPHNRSFVRLKNSGLVNQSAANRPGAQGPATLSPDSRQVMARTNSVGMFSPPAAASMPEMPRLRPMPQKQAELTATDRMTNLLGVACRCYVLRQPGEVMEVWATDQLLSFQPYLQTQPHRFGPRMIEEQWGEILKVRKLFPMLAVLKSESGLERMRFAVKSVTREEIRNEEAQALFQTPPDYQETDPPGR